jgi:hypothetical protein
VDLLTFPEGVLIRLSMVLCIPFDQTFQPIDSYSMCVNNDFIFIIVGGVVNPAAPDPSTPVAGG